MDAHARTIHVAVLRPGAKGPEEWQLASERRAVKRLARRLSRDAGGPVVACYEAGPAGFALQRRLEAEGIDPALDLSAVLAFRPTRTVARDGTVKYGWRTLQLLPSPQRPQLCRSAGGRAGAARRAAV